MKQVRIAVIGPPDIGKSRFIKELVKYVTGKDLSPDTLMDEVHWSDGKDPYGNPDTRTIKCAKIIFRQNNKEFLFVDCPGHREYIDGIKKGVLLADYVIELRDKANAYYVERDLGMYINTHILYPRSKGDGGLTCYNFDDEDGKNSFYKIIDRILAKDINKVDLEEEAITNLKSVCSKSDNNIIFYSGGKDSVVGLDLVRRSNIPCKVYVPWSGYDFPEVEEFITKIEKNHIKFDNSGGKKYTDDPVSAYIMMQEKAYANNRFIKQFLPDNLFINYRASDEGVRSKSSWRQIIREGNKFINKISPVFYFSELDIWQYILKYKLPVCPLYFKGYRSLGDQPVTAPCMPQFDKIQDIIDWIKTNPTTSERDGRGKQDKSVPFAMEKLRNIGFF